MLGKRKHHLRLVKNEQWVTELVCHERRNEVQSAALIFELVSTRNEHRRTGCPWSMIFQL